MKADSGWLAGTELRAYKLDGFKNVSFLIVH